MQSINSNLERELQLLQKSMAETIKMANTAFEAKEKAIQEMNVLKVQVRSVAQSLGAHVCIHVQPGVGPRRLTAGDELRVGRLAGYRATEPTASLTLDP